MHQITVKTEYIDKLKSLGIYDQWLANVKAVHGTKSCRPELMKDWYEFINWSFTWEETPEEHSFWKKIAER